MAAGPHRGTGTLRRWVERGLTFVAFVIGGYAYGSLYSVLSGQVSHQVGDLLLVAGAFLFVYGWLIHLEPFLAEWRLRGGLAAMALYTCVALAALLLGAAIEDSVLFAPRSVDLAVVGLAVFFILLGLTLFKLLGADRREDGASASC